MAFGPTYRRCRWRRRRPASCRPSATATSPPSVAFTARAQGKRVSVGSNGAKRIFGAFRRVRPASRLAARARASRTYGCSRGRRSRSGCPRGRRGRARRAGVAGEGRQRADVEGHEPAAGRGGGRVGAEARLPDITRRENLHVRRIRSCYQFHSPFASSNCKNRASAGEFRQAIDLFSRACYYQNRCKKIQPKFAPNSNSSEGKHGGRQPEQRESRLAPTRLQVI